MRSISLLSENHRLELRSRSQPASGRRSACLWKGGAGRAGAGPGPRKGRPKPVLGAFTRFYASQSCFSAVFRVCSSSEHGAQLGRGPRVCAKGGVVWGGGRPARFEIESLE